MHHASKSYVTSGGAVQLYGGNLQTRILMSSSIYRFTQGNTTHVTAASYSQVTMGASASFCKLSVIIFRTTILMYALTSMVSYTAFVSQQLLWTKQPAPGYSCVYTAVEQHFMLGRTEASSIAEPSCLHCTLVQALSEPRTLESESCTFGCHCC